MEGGHVLDIKQLQYFLMVCEESSFGQAAQKLFLTPQAVSKAITSLESELGCSLFYRTKNGVQMTAYAHFLRENSIDVVEKVNLLIQQFAEFREKYSETLTCGLAFGIITHVTLEDFDKFRKNFPHIMLNFHEMMNLECEKGVENETLDVALTLGPVDHNKFDCVDLKRWNMTAIVNVNHPLAPKQEISIEDLRGQKLICNAGKNRQNLLFLCREKGFEPLIVYETADFDTKLSLVETGDYMAFGVAYVTDRCKSNDKVRILPFQKGSYEWEMCAITKRSCSVKESVSTFIHYVRSVVYKRKKQTDVR
jgi:DNA-binding transcriptional LysR family regulator